VAVELDRCAAAAEEGYHVLLTRIKEMAGQGLGLHNGGGVPSPLRTSLASSALRAGPRSMDKWLASGTIEYYKSELLVGVPAERACAAVPGMHSRSGSAGHCSRAGQEPRAAQQPTTRTPPMAVAYSERGLHVAQGLDNDSGLIMAVSANSHRCGTAFDLGVGSAYRYHWPFQ
jgi:hypothetical protein